MSSSSRRAVCLEIIEARDSMMQRDVSAESGVKTGNHRRRLRRGKDKREKTDLCHISLIILNFSFFQLIIALNTIRNKILK